MSATALNTFDRTIPAVVVAIIALLLPIQGRAEEVLRPYDCQGEVGAGPGFMGNELVGVAYLSDRSRMGDEDPIVHLPQRVSSQLCVHIISDDGKYSGYSYYRLRQGKPGRYRLRLCKANRNTLAALQVPKIAIMAEMSDACPDLHNGQIVPVAFSAAPSGAALRLLLNCGSELASIRIGGKTQACNRLEKGWRTYFDTECRVEVGEGMHVVELDLSTSLNPTPRKRQFSIWVP